MSRNLLCCFALLVLAGLAAPYAARAQPPPADGFTEEDVRYASGDLTLAAALLVPEGGGPYPAAVILQGSGDSDRTNRWARSIAEALARGGVAVLLTDKRGSGLSDGDWKTADFHDLADDALAGVVYVRSRPEIAGDQIGLVGLSQGGHIAPLAAAMTDTVAFVVDVSGAAVTLLEQINHEMRQTARQAGLSEELVEEVMALQALAERYVRTGEWEPYHAALQVGLQSSWRPIAEGFPQTPDSWVWEWARLNGDFDPLPHWREVRAPVLVVYGAEDERDNVPVTESVRRLEAVLEEDNHADWTIRVFEGVGHGLLDMSGPDHATHGLLQDFVELLVSWVRARTADA